MAFVIFITLIWIFSQVSADGEMLESNVTLTWNESRKHCEGIGKVLFDAKRNDYDTSLSKLLKDNNQAWVSARVEFSHFVKVPVCITASTEFAQKKSFDTDIIGKCLKFCIDYLYAGLKDTDCYCFKNSTMLTMSMNCNSACIYDSFHQCGGNESISLYEKVDKTITRRIVDGCKECIYAMNNRNGVKLFTASCVGHVLDGAMCEEVKYKVCKDSNGTFLNKKLCRLERNDSLIWKQARQECASIGGHLMSSSFSSLNILDILTYWLGFYRILMIHEVNAQDLVTNDSCCPVARRDGDKVLIEGDYCHAEHAFICQDDNLDRSSASPQSTEKPIMGEQSKSDYTDGKIIYGVIAVSALLLVSLLITAIICIFRHFWRRRQVSQERSNGSATNSMIEQHVLLEKQSTNPPSKPSRNALTKKECIQSSYENVALVCGKQDVSIQQSGYSNFEYDKINLDKANKQENDYKDDDTHVYNHGSLNRTEEQYDVMVMSGVMTPIMDDTYDRTTL